MGRVESMSEIERVNIQTEKQRNRKNSIIIFIYCKDGSYCPGTFVFIVHIFFWRVALEGQISKLMSYLTNCSAI